MSTLDPDYLQLEIRSDALMTLVNQGVLAVEDLRALNPQSQEGVRSILLSVIGSLSPT